MKKLLIVASLVLVGACGVKLPPIQLPKIVIAPPVDAPALAPAPKPIATIAFQVVDEASLAPITIAFVRFDHDGLEKQVNEDGYVAFEREVGIYDMVTFSADDYVTVTRRFQLEANRQFTVRLKSTKPAPIVPPALRTPVFVPPVVEPVVVPPPAPPATPVVVSPPTTPASVLCDTRESDPLSCVRQVAAKYPRLLVINLFESCVEFTQRVLEVLGSEWGHVAKTAGESQSVPKGFTPIVVNGFSITGVSHDAIKHRSTGQVVDILGNASANSDPDPKIHGPASIQWALVPREHWRDNNPFIPAVPVR